jgi:Family of unknown function (DUF6931)
MAESSAKSTVSPSEILQRAELSEDAKKVFRDELSAEEYIANLSGANLFTDAVKYRAHALEPRSCIEWSVSCVRKLQPQPTPPEEQALQGVEKWLSEPNDANRRQCKTLADQAQLSTAPGCLAMAVFFAEGSIAPAGGPDVRPAPTLTGKIAASGIILAVVGEPTKAAERYRICLALAQHADK